LYQKSKIGIGEGMSNPVAPRCCVPGFHCALSLVPTGRLDVGGTRYPGRQRLTCCSAKMASLLHQWIV